jgi:hypothetical protein
MAEESFRDALEIAKAIIPYSVTKKDKLQQDYRSLMSDKA